MSDLQVNLINNVRLLMRLRGVSQEGLGEILELAQPQVSRRLRQKIRWTVDDLEKVSARFGVDLMMLFETVPVMLRWLADQVEKTGYVPWDMPYEQDDITLTCNAASGSQGSLAFDQTDEEDVIDLRDPEPVQAAQKGALDLYEYAN